MLNRLQKMRSNFRILNGSLPKEQFWLRAQLFLNLGSQGWRTNDVRAVQTNRSTSLRETVTRLCGKRMWITSSTLPAIAKFPSERRTSALCVDIILSAHWPSRRYSDWPLPFKTNLFLALQNFTISKQLHNFHPSHVVQVGYLYWLHLSEDDLR